MGNNLGSFLFHALYHRLELAMGREGAWWSVSLCALAVCIAVLVWSRRGRNRVNPGAPLSAAQVSKTEPPAV